MKEHKIIIHMRNYKINRGVNLLFNRGGKESRQELNLNEGPGIDMKVPVQNSVCCLLKLDPLSGWRPHDAQGWHQHGALWETIQRFSRCTELPFITSAGTQWGREPLADLFTVCRWPAQWQTHSPCLTHILTLFWSKHKKNPASKHICGRIRKQSGLISSGCYYTIMKKLIHNCVVTIILLSCHYNEQTNLTASWRCGPSCLT